jgi:glycosyl transferase family 25
LPEDFDIIRLETSTNRMLLDKYPIRISSDRFLYRVRSTSWCAGAYILSRSCARKLISVPKSCHNKTDYFLFCHEHSSIAKELTVYQFFPAVATQDQFLTKRDEMRQFPSNINENTKLLGRLVTYFKNATPYAICKSIYKSLLGFKRVPFRP